jgi:hypothetical protein
MKKKRKKKKKGGFNFAQIFMQSDVMKSYMAWWS